MTTDDSHKGSHTTKHRLSDQISANTQNTWRDHRGRPARWPDLEHLVRLRTTRVVLAAAHLDHDPRNNRLRNLRGFCQRCHLRHDRPHHQAQRWITYRLRRAVGDLFLGSYQEARLRPRPVRAAR